MFLMVAAEYAMILTSPRYRIETRRSKHICNLYQSRARMA